MRQFFNLSAARKADLQARASGNCLTFPNQEMPPPSVPFRARIGIEVDLTDASATLLVDHGIRYAGAQAEIREWLESGSKNFIDLPALLDWVQKVLRPVYETASPLVPQITNHTDLTAVRPVAELTDLQAIQQNLKGQAKGLPLRANDLYHELAKEIRGQDEALFHLSQRLTHALARTAPRRPATFFALGPTGVGKTKTAECLPRAINALRPQSGTYTYLRLDMNEYQEPHRISQLLGAPPGYVGYGEGALLSDALRANPHTIVLFDEIEKAHPRIFQALMNALDAGRLTTASGGGQELDCRQAIFFFTSNLKASEILREIEQRGCQRDRQMSGEVCRRHLRNAGVVSELVGRIGSYLLYYPLSSEARLEILAASIARIGAEYGLHIEKIDPTTVQFVFEQTLPTEFGVRPDEYLLDDLLGDAFAQAVRQGEEKHFQVCGPPFVCLPLAEAHPCRSESH